MPGYQAHRRLCGIQCGGKSRVDGVCTHIGSAHTYFFLYGKGDVKIIRDLFDFFEVFDMGYVFYTHILQNQIKGIL